MLTIDFKKEIPNEIDSPISWRVTAAILFLIDKFIMHIIVSVILKIDIFMNDIGLLN